MKRNSLQKVTVRTRKNPQMTMTTIQQLVKMMSMTDSLSYKKTLYAPTMTRQQYQRTGFFWIANQLSTYF